MVAQQGPKLASCHGPNKSTAPYGTIFYEKDLKPAEQLLHKQKIKTSTLRWVGEAETQPCQNPRPHCSDSPGGGVGGI